MEHSLGSEGATPRLISYCTTVKDRAPNLRRLLKFMDELQSPPFEVHIADFRSRDYDWRNGDEIKNHDFPIRVLTLTHKWFNRSMGLNRAAEYSNAEGEDPLFFIDVDMWIGPVFNDLIRKTVIPGQCWFPICYSLHKGKPRKVNKNSMRSNLANGWWRKTGHGMFGVTADDFKKLKWNETMGKTWGGEDGNMSRQAANKGLKRVRNRCAQLMHIWHPRSRKNYQGGR